MAMNMDVSGKRRTAGNKACGDQFRRKLTGTVKLDRPPVRRCRERRSAPYHSLNLLVDAGNAGAAREPDRGHAAAPVEAERDRRGAAVAAAARIGGILLVAREVRGDEPADSWCRCWSGRRPTLFAAVDGLGALASRVAFSRVGASMRRRSLAVRGILHRLRRRGLHGLRLGLRSRPASAALPRPASARPRPASPPAAAAARHPSCRAGSRAARRSRSRASGSPPSRSRASARPAGAPRAARPHCRPAGARRPGAPASWSARARSPRGRPERSAAARSPSARPRAADRSAAGRSRRLRR